MSKNSNVVNSTTLEKVFFFFSSLVSYYLYVDKLLLLLFLILLELKYEPINRARVYNKLRRTDSVCELVLIFKLIYFFMNLIVYYKFKGKLALPPMNYQSLSICPLELPRLPKTPHELLFCYQRPLTVSQRR
jgi:hypothetical protein